MLSPELSILIMFIASVIIGYVTMPIILGNNSPYIRYHINKLMGSVLMGFTMAFVELLMHMNMLSTMKIIIYTCIITIGIIITIFLIQTQAFVGPIDFLNGMIEHHAMGIAMADKFKYFDIQKFITPPEYSQLANLAKNIITTQSSEIKLMDKLLKFFENI